MNTKSISPNNQMQLSLCMIVKDEETSLPACLESVKDVVDEIIIVDTGSTDQTINIAQTFGANIHKFSWCDDFSAARNESIKYAKGKWILWMDADEQLEDNSKYELRKLVTRSNHPAGVSLILKNISSKNVSFGTAYRMFSNFHGIQFKNPIHEQVSYSLRKNKANILNSNIVINHFGYDETKFDQKKKRDRNLPILIKMATDEPDGYFPQFLLGQHYASDLIQKDKAIFHFQNFLNKHPKERNLIASAYSTLSEIYYSKHEFKHALNFANKSVSLSPKQFIGYLLLSKIEVELKQYQAAISRLETLILNNKNNQNFSSDNALDCVLNSNQIEGFIIKILFFHLNRDESVKRMNNIWKNANDFGDINQLFYEWKDEEKDTLLQWIKKNQSSHTILKESLGILGFLYLIKNEYIKALPIFQNLFDQGNRSPLYIKSLAGIYAKMGQLDKAGDLLKCLT